jgi:hypothetical protein
MIFLTYCKYKGSLKQTISECCEENLQACHSTFEEGMRVTNGQSESNFQVVSLLSEHKSNLRLERLRSCPRKQFCNRHPQIPTSHSLLIDTITTAQRNISYSRIHFTTTNPHHHARNSYLVQR